MSKVDFRTVKTKNLRNPRDRAPLTMIDRVKYHTYHNFGLLHIIPSYVYTSCLL